MHLPSDVYTNANEIRVTMDNVSVNIVHPVHVYVY